MSAAQTKRDAAAFPAEHRDETSHSPPRESLTALLSVLLSLLDLDHTADIQLHSWGETLSEALEQVVLAMFSYVTDLTRVDIDPTRTDTFTVKGQSRETRGGARELALRRFVGSRESQCSRSRSCYCCC